MGAAAASFLERINNFLVVESQRGAVDSSFRVAQGMNPNNFTGSRIENGTSAAATARIRIVLKVSG
jgi:hypothetical protein